MDTKEHMIHIGMFKKLMEPIIGLSLSQHQYSISHMKKACLIIVLEILK